MWRSIFAKKVAPRRPPSVRIVKCQHDPQCPNPGTIPIPVGSEVRWFCQPHAVQFRTNAVAQYVMSASPSPITDQRVYKNRTKPHAQIQSLPQAANQAMSEIAGLPEGLRQELNNHSVDSIPLAENDNDIESFIPQSSSIRTQLRYRNMILAAVTVKDSTGRREAILVRRIPPQLDKFSIKRLKRSYIVDLARAYLVLGGMRLLIWDINNPSPILFNETMGPRGLTIEGQIVDSQMLYTLSDTNTIKNLVTASSAKPTEISMMGLFMIVLATIAGFFAGGALGPRLGMSACSVVATTTTTVTHMAPLVASMVKMRLHI